ncbi:universal stress protein [Tardiphaga sp.]|uniref:universal stress protein n=1 Tax=Tardiphaga sp. TaxID=1926292 RepID=UPI0025D523CE|nr:universal stress protein [Tardiphaga sp.]
MIKDIVIHLPVDRPIEPALDCAISLGKMFGAHLQGLVATYQVINPAIAVGPTAALFAAPTEYNTDPEAANDRLARFVKAANGARIATTTGCVSNTPRNANHTLAAISRLSGLSVVTQPEQARPTHDFFLAETLLVQSGRPILLIPHIHHGPLKTARALVCWDGGRAAARALHDAMPLLRRAQNIDVIAIHAGNARAAEAGMNDLARHMNHYGLPARLHHATADPSDVHNTILSTAADLGSDYLVMGGYGHSQLGELILGSTTREMFNPLTIPALMSH